jgi:hypothetical protein
MKNQLTSIALLLGLSLTSAFAKAADAKTFVFECSVVRKFMNPDGTANREPVATKILEILDSSSIEIPISVKTGKSSKDATVKASTIIQQIPDFPQQGDWYSQGSMMLTVTYENQGKGTPPDITLMDSSDKNKYPFVGTGALFTVGPNTYIVTCSVNEKENAFSPAPTSVLK